IRAKRTAELISGRSDVIVDEQLIETDFGEWEGKPKSVFIKENPAVWEAWKNDPTDAKAGGTGETAGEVVRRGDDFFKSILQENSRKIMVVAHNGFNRLYLSHKLGMPLKNYRKLFLNNASVTVFTLDEEGEMILESV